MPFERQHAGELEGSRPVVNPLGRPHLISIILGGGDIGSDPPRRGRGRWLNRQQFQLKDQGAVGRYAFVATSLAVGQIRRDKNLPLGVLLHQLQGLAGGIKEVVASGGY